MAYGCLVILFIPISVRNGKFKEVTLSEVKLHSIAARQDNDEQHARSSQAAEKDCHYEVLKPSRGDFLLRVGRRSRDLEWDDGAKAGKV